MRSGHHRVALVLALIVIATLFAPTLDKVHGAGADGSLIVAALDVLKREYPKPVNSVALLNAAIAALRKSTNLGPDKLPDLSAGLDDSKVVATFRQEFADAVRLGPIQEPELAYSATRGMLNSLNDSQVFYQTPAQREEEQRRASGKPDFEGIGVTITSRKDASGNAWIFVEDVYSGSPAQSAGLRRFDRIVEADGKPLQNMTSAEASQILRGPTSSTVNLKIQRSSEVLNVSVQRAAIKVPPVDGQLIRPGIAYVRLRAFPQGIGDLLRTELRTLESKGPITAVVLDLRGNGGGGRFRDAESAAGTFLPQDTMIARVIEHGQAPSILKTAGPALLQQAKLVALVDKGTTVNAEIITIAIKDAHRGTIVGEKTGGALGGGHWVSLPAGAMFVRLSEIAGPNYEQIERAGIVPDIEVTMTEADMERAQDPQLDAALKAVGAI
jgi:carboxyl-terminal processing protease